jgi:hypothetical protein
MLGSSQPCTVFPRRCCVDEPEAHLHPTLARRLGSDLASLALARQTSLIAATHSEEFLMGCVSQVPETAIVRLTLDAGIATARVVPGDQVATLTRDPLLRSAEALKALFSHCLAVCRPTDSLQAPGAPEHCPSWGTQASRRQRRWRCSARTPRGATQPRRHPGGGRLRQYLRTHVSCVTIAVGIGEA